MQGSKPLGVHQCLLFPPFDLQQRCYWVDENRFDMKVRTNLSECRSMRGSNFRCCGVGFALHKDRLMTDHFM